MLSSSSSSVFKFLFEDFFDFTVNELKLDKDEWEWSDFCDLAVKRFSSISESESDDDELEL